MTVDSIDTHELKYYLLPGKTYPWFEHQAVYNKVYLFWRSIWAQVFFEHGKPDALSADDFCRQDVIHAVIYRDQVVSIGLNSLFNFASRSTVDQKYFSSFTEDNVRYLKDERVQSLLSMEFLTVCPDFRKLNTGFSFAHVVAELGFLLLRNLDLDVAVATVRKEKYAMINELASRLGGEVLQEDVLRGNILCDLMCVFQKSYRPLPDPRVRDLVEYLWSRRIDLTQLTGTNTKGRMVA